MTKKFVTMVKIAVPFDGEPHAMQTKAQNLAANASAIKKALADLIAAVDVTRGEFADKLRDVVVAAAASKEDKAQYEHDLKNAIQEIQNVFDANAEIDLAISTATDNAKTALHDSECITPIPEPLYGKSSDEGDDLDENYMGDEAAEG